MHLTSQKPYKQDRGIQYLKCVEEKEKNNLEFCNLKNYPSKVKKKINIFWDKLKLRESVASRPAMQEMLKEVLLRKRNGLVQKLGST